MLRLIVGLGNPGQQYEKTRHNVGFLFLDELVEDGFGQWSYLSGFEGHVAELVTGAVKLVMLKPATYMNKSGASVGKLARYYKIEPENILVVHDELDFDVGVIKLKRGGGHAGHNGLRDIIANLGSADFYRLRVGIGRPGDGKKVADYVLSAPTATDRAVLATAFANGKSYFSEMVVGDMGAVMNKMNA